MSLVAIVASVSPKGITVVDSQAVLVPILGGGLITLNFTSPDDVMVAAEAIAFNVAAVAPPVVLVPETLKNSKEVISIDDTPPPTPTEQRMKIILMKTSFLLRAFTEPKSIATTRIPLKTPLA
jgi:hypothetical protein